MPNRILNERICSSVSIIKLSWLEEVTFYRLIVNVDDYGRLDARLRFLKSRLFPMEDVEIEDIATALYKFEREKMVTLYQADDQPYLELRNWGEYQTIRNKKSKYPDPTGIEIDFGEEYEGLINAGVIHNSQASESNCKQLQSSENNCKQLHVQSNPIQSNPNPNPIQFNPQRVETAENSSNLSTKSSDDLMEESFDQFWKAYPKKVSKGQAQTTWKKLWNRLEMDEAFVEKILETVRKQKLKGGKLAGEVEYIPYPSTWLNALSWEDEDGIGRNLEGEDWEYGDPEEFEMLFAWENEASGE